MMKINAGSGNASIVGEFDGISSNMTYIDRFHYFGRIINLWIFFVSEYIKIKVLNILVQFNKY